MLKFKSKKQSYLYLIQHKQKSKFIILKHQMKDIYKVKIKERFIKERNELIIIAQFYYYFHISSSNNRHNLQSTKLSLKDLKKRIMILLILF